MKDIQDQINGERLYLRRLNESDITDSMMEWFRNSDLMKYYTNSKKEITRQSLSESIREGEVTRTNYTYGIYVQNTNECIGTIRLGPINYHHMISDLIVLIGNTNFHGKGLAVDAIRLGNKLAFEYFNLRKLFGGMYENNLSSIKAYTRADWVIEGRLKGHYLENEKPLDRILVGCFNPKYFTK